MVGIMLSFGARDLVLGVVTRLQIAFNGCIRVGDITAVYGTDIVGRIAEIGTFNVSIRLLKPKPFGDGLESRDVSVPISTFNQSSKFIISAEDANIEGSHSKDEIIQMIIKNR